MDIIEAIYQRKSIRGFKSDPVSRDILTKILDAACRVPSALHTQSWEFVVLMGDVLDGVRAAIGDKLNKKEPMHRNRDVSVSWSNDSIDREWQGFRFFDAPVGILILTENLFSDVGPLLDLGAAMQTLCLAALNFGLGTCIEDQGVLYPGVLRKIAQIPENRKILTAIAVGYPDWDFPANPLVTSRESLDNNTHWVGF
jgi:nitroreductase